MVYQAKTLFSGIVIGVEPSLHLVGVPNNKPYTRAYFQGEYMTLHEKDILGYRTFDDKFGRDKLYKLAYYEWKPDPKQADEVGYTDEGLKQLHNAMAQIFKKGVRK